MPRTPLVALSLALLLAAPTAADAAPDAARDGHRKVVHSGERVQLQRFGSRADLRRFLRTFIQPRPRPRRSSTGAKMERSAPSSSAPAADAGPSAAGESITNTQEAGVDEGGIVKVRGDHLVVLRRGRLFTVDVGATTPRPISMIDVSPPGRRHDSWYDEMLISGDTVVVVGYSYQFRATELALFRIDARGRLRYQATHFLRSNDYYSARNYASRLLGNKLVFYMPHSLVGYGRGGNEQISLPAVRRAGARGFTDVIRSTEIFKPIQQVDRPVLHTVVVCDLRGGFQCRARGIIGPGGRTFYVSQSAVYVWVSGGPSRGLARQGIEEAPAVVYRLPLDGGLPGALRVSGAPVDQFSFRESGGNLNVLVRAESGGDAMWRSEATSGDVALMSVPVRAFSRRVGTAARAAYAELPRPTAGWVFQNRFVGDHLLYGTGTGWGRQQAERDDRVYIHSLGAGRTAAVSLSHGVDRIEALGSDAVVVGGSGQDLHFTAIDLGAAPRVAGLHVQKDAAQGELRSHGFFFRPTGAGEGVLGLPIRSGGSAGHRHLVEGSAQVLFLEVEGLRFRRLGALAARPERVDDRCVVSCVDWYGNARPIFYRGRVFALLGYELVEGRVDRGTIDEVARVDFLTQHLAQLAR